MPAIMAQTDGCVGVYDSFNFWGSVFDFSKFKITVNDIDICFSILLINFRKISPVRPADSMIIYA